MTLPKAVLLMLLCAKYTSLTMNSSAGSRDLKGASGITSDCDKNKELLVPQLF
ncbi:hypothetical protein J2X05_000228 [Cellvibrio fibrivorans]|uniref:Uncharacterized protein n=1 Tax=Cellvibrio fibrivorans TaxID=126350 RepID=A0ABU1USU0_9GAMM|nr:hypothetical protein [Cellvibrio fibrivorans]